MAGIGVHHKTTPPLILEERGELTQIQVVSTYSNLERHVGERQLKSAADLLREAGLRFSETLEEVPAIGAGCQLMIHAAYEQGSCAFTALGERGKPAEKVGEEAALEFLEFHRDAGAVDYHLADQLLLPLAIQRKRCRYTFNKVSEHLLTNSNIVGKFLQTEIRIEGEPGKPGSVEIHPTTG